MQHVVPDSLTSGIFRYLALGLFFFLDQDKLASAKTLDQNTKLLASGMVGISKK